MINRRLTATACMVAMLSALPAHAGDENMDPETLAQQATLSLGNGDGWNSGDVKRAIQSYGECIARLDKAFAANPALRTKTDLYIPKVPKWSQQGGGSSGMGATKMVPHSDIRDLCVSRLADAKKVDAAQSAAADSNVKARLNRTARNYADIQKLVGEARAAAKAGKFLKAGSDSPAKTAYDASIRDFDDALQGAPWIRSTPCANVPGAADVCRPPGLDADRRGRAGHGVGAPRAEIASARTAYDAAIKKGLAGLGRESKGGLAADRAAELLRGKVRSTSSTGSVRSAAGRPTGGPT